MIKINVIIIICIMKLVIIIFLVLRLIIEILYLFK